MKEKDRSSHCRSNCVNVPKFVNVSIGLDSLRIVRTVVLAVARTASMYLSSLTFAKVHREKATGFGGSYREIIMKKFRIFYQTKLGGLYLMVLLYGGLLKEILRKGADRKNRSEV